MPRPKSATIGLMRHIAPLFDHLVGAGEQRERDAETERLCDLNVRQRAASATALGMIALVGSECEEDVSRGARLA